MQTPSTKNNQTTNRNHRTTQTENVDSWPKQTGTNTSTINTGLAEPNRIKVAEGLSRLLADSFTLYLQTQNYHWNVTGPMFKPLHDMFQEQYTELASAIDEVAERIRALDVPAPGTFAEFSDLRSIQETRGLLPAGVMLRCLLENHESISRTSKALVQTAMTAGNEATADLVIQRIQLHEKTAWMLRRTLEK